MIEIYNSKVAKLYRTLTGNSSVAIGPFVLFSCDETEVTAARLRHLEVHARQWTEVTLISIVLVLIFDGLNIGGIISAAFVYYIWWGIEIIVRSLIGFLSGLDANSVAFEQEAEEAEGSENLAKKLFGWVKYLND